STMREGSSTVVVRGQASSEDQDSITFFSGNCLLVLHTTSSEDEEAKDMLTRLADQLAPKLAAGAAAPRMVAALPNFERLRGSEKYFMGSKSASHFSSAPFLETLNLDRSLGAACADYLYSRPMAERLKLVVAEYANPTLASNAFNAYSSSLTEFAQKIVQRSSVDCIAKLSESYLMVGIAGQKVFVISGARRASSPRILAREVLR
ncbi:MAG: hypothetical protein K2X81_10470, partial [Candidatus Obscuribacterales bacterium]|nr:hypothetical protein [Candidatus Obscuribacterales bacterium]